MPRYDAFVIYSDKDTDFASELIEKCENLGFRLCCKDRDFLGGLTFESESVLNLLINRCNYLIVIVSNAFFENKKNIFYTIYARAMGIDEDKAKVIPCIIEQCELPYILRYCHGLELFRDTKLYNFWKKLYEALRINPQNKILCNNKSEKIQMESNEIVNRNRFKLRMKAFKRSFFLQYSRKYSRKTNQNK